MEAAGEEPVPTPPCDHVATRRAQLIHSGLLQQLALARLGTLRLKETQTSRIARLFPEGARSSLA